MVLFQAQIDSSEQAEVLTEYLQKSQVTSIENLATKNDVKLLGTEFRAEMAELKTEVRAEMAALKNELIIKLGGMIAVGIGVLAAINTLT